MPAALAPTGAPANALRVWCDSHYIYAELPSKLGAECPCIMSFPRDGRGFQKLLGTLYGFADNSALMPENFHAGRKLVGTATQHAAAASLLRQRGIIK